MTEERFPRRDFLKATASTALTFSAGLPAKAQTSASATPSPATTFSTVAAVQSLLGGDCQASWFGLIGMRERVMALSGQLDIIDLGDRALSSTL
jgi:hypothetical protein